MYGWASGSHSAHQNPIDFPTENIVHEKFVVYLSFILNVS